MKKLNEHVFEVLNDWLSADDWEWKCSDCDVHRSGFSSMNEAETDGAHYHNPTDYERGYREGEAEKRDNPDSTWHPQGAWGWFERGYNDGWNGTPRRDPEGKTSE